MLKKLVRILKALDTGMARLEAAALGFGVIAMTLVSVVNVFMRNIVGESLTFADEVNQLLIVMITFLGVGYAARQGRHIRMTAFFDALPRLPRKLAMMLIAASTALLLFALAWYSVDYAIHARRIGAVTPSLQIPLWLGYSVVPLGLAVGGLQYLLTVFRNLVETEVYVSATRRDEYDEAPTAEI